MKHLSNPVKVIMLILFILTLLYDLFWIIGGIVGAIRGVDAGWVAPALSSGEKDYGIDAFWSAIVMGAIFTVMKLWFIPLYQFGYLIYCVTMKIKK